MKRAGSWLGHCSGSTVSQSQSKMSTKKEPDDDSFSYSESAKEELKQLDKNVKRSNIYSYRL